MRLVLILPALFLLSACGGGSPSYSGNERPADSVMDQFYRTAAGCTYARAQSPGYAVTWHIVANPAVMNMPPNPPNCPPIL